MILQTRSFQLCWKSPLTWSLSIFQWLVLRSKTTICIKMELHQFGKRQFLLKCQSFSTADFRRLISVSNEIQIKYYCSGTFLVWHANLAYYKATRVFAVLYKCWDTKAYLHNLDKAGQDVSIQILLPHSKCAIKINSRPQMYLRLS